MTTNGSISSQCTGRLVAKIGPRSTVITISLSAHTARRIDPSAFIIQLRDAAGRSETHEMPMTPPQISGKDAQFQWVLPNTPQPAEAVVSMWAYDGTRHDLGLTLAVQGAA